MRPTCSLCGSRAGRPECQRCCDPWVEPTAEELAVYRAEGLRLTAARERQEAEQRAQLAAWASLGRPLRLGLVGCGASKLDHPAPARELYTGALFRKSFALASRTCDVVRIASALHGILEPERVIAPYDYTLATARKVDREAWGSRAAWCLALDFPGLELEIHLYAGATYAIRPEPRWRIVRPLAGLGIGHRLQALTAALAAGDAPIPREFQGPAAHADSRI